MGGCIFRRRFPKWRNLWRELGKLNYQELAYEVLSKFLDFTEEELKACIRGAYDEKFDTPEIVPVVKKGDALFLELFHGRTLAFKDMALSILPYLMKIAAKKNGLDKEIVILTGDKRRYRQGGTGGLCERGGYKNYGILPGGRGQPRAEAADEYTGGREYLRGGH